MRVIIKCESKKPDSVYGVFRENHLDFFPVGVFFFCSFHAKFLLESKHLYRVLTIVNVERFNC